MLTIADFFKMQDTLNERVGLDAEKFAKVFSTNPNSVVKQQSKIEAGIWIDDLLKGMASEMEELRNCTFWKHWCQEAQEGRRYEIKDVEAARKKIIDLLHLWVSLAQTLGMTPEMVCGMHTSNYPILTKDYAWHLFKMHRDISPRLGSLVGESLEDLPPKAQSFYITWAEDEIDATREAEGDKGLDRIKQEMSDAGSQALARGQAGNCVGAGEGCKYCGQPDCTIRRYQSTLPATS